MQRNAISLSIDELQAFMEEAGAVVGATAVDQVMQHFEDEALTGVRNWPKRKYTTALQRGKKLLSDRGTLRDSVRWELRNAGTEVVIGVDGDKVPYAEIHNEGGTIMVTPKMKRFFWAKYMEAGGKAAEGKGDTDFYKAMALKKIGEVITIPQRTFLDITPIMEDRIDEALDDLFTRKFPRS